MKITLSIIITCKHESGHIFPRGKTQSYLFLEETDSRYKIIKLNEINVNEIYVSYLDFHSPHLAENVWRTIKSLQFYLQPVGGDRALRVVRIAIVLWAHYCAEWTRP